MPPQYSPQSAENVRETLHSFHRKNSNEKEQFTYLLLREHQLHQSAVSYSVFPTTVIKEEPRKLNRNWNTLRKWQFHFPGRPEKDNRRVRHVYTISNYWESKRFSLKKKTIQMPLIRLLPLMWSLLKWHKPCNIICSNLATIIKLTIYN